MQLFDITGQLRAILLAAQEEVLTVWPIILPNVTLYRRSDQPNMASIWVSISSPRQRTVHNVGYR